MKVVSLQPIDKSPVIKTDDRVLDALLAEEVDVLMACGGKGRCATCHVFVESGQDCLSEKSSRENRTLQRLSNAGGSSRLACQARVEGEGVEVRLPDGMYVTEVQDIEELIGTRAQEHIRHPITGELLIPEGKIITRTFIMKLDGLDAELTNVRSSEIYD